MKTFRLACILLISVLVTTSMLSGTFAKYSTSANIVEKARVAKWGVEVEMYGNLFGEAYDGVFDTITNKEDNSVTVKTIQKATVNDLVSPGTKVVDGLHFSISGSTESAIQIDYRIVNQNVALRPNLYGIMEKIGDISEEDYNNLLKQGKSLYKKVDRLLTGSEPNNTNIEKPGYVKANLDDAKASTVIYELYNIVEVNHPTNTNANYPYCPVVFELQSSNSGSLKGYYNGGQVSPMTGGRYWIYRNEKTLDVLSAAIENQFTNSLTWPAAAQDTDWKFIREGSQTYNANTDLSSLHLVDEQLTWSWRFEQYADNANPYARLYEDGSINPDQIKGYNAADTILSTLAGKKIDSTQDSRKYDDIEVVIHNRSLTFSSQRQVIFSAYKRNNGSFDITRDALKNYNDLANEWIIPNEYEDYCLDVDFELEFTITQLD